MKQSDSRRKDQNVFQVIVLIYHYKNILSKVAQKMQPKKELIAWGISPTPKQT